MHKALPLGTIGIGRLLYRRRLNQLNRFLEMFYKFILLFSTLFLISTVVILIEISVITGKRKLKNSFVDEDGKIRWILIISGLSAAVGFVILTIFSLYVNKIEDNSTWGTKLGQYGDFIGGVVATFFSLTGVLLLFETLRNQRHEFRKNGLSQLKQSFETKFFELIRFHRENISEIKYTKFYRSELQTSEARKVFRVIAAEYLECFQELKRFIKLYPGVEFIKPKYKIHLRKVREMNNCDATIEELAIIDISYCYFFFGVSKESEPIILQKFFTRYDKAFITKLKMFFQLKPKSEFSLHFKNWKFFMEKNIVEMKDLFEDIYLAKANPSLNISDEVKAMLQNLKMDKYYGGHQHRLGHYFRHLFQSYKFLSLQDFLSTDEKYFYAKTFRAQISTYEQLMLFFNSLSSLGMKWDYTPDTPVNLNSEDFKFITKYQLIKNLPGSQYFEFEYRKYYEKVKFEFQDDPTYT